MLRLTSKTIHWKAHTSGRIGQCRSNHDITNVFRELSLRDIGRLPRLLESGREESQHVAAMSKRACEPHACFLELLFENGLSILVQPLDLLKHLLEGGCSETFQVAQGGPSCRGSSERAAA